jgi:hypothetical protein
MSEQDIVHRGTRMLDPVRLSLVAALLAVTVVLLGSLLVAQYAHTYDRGREGIDFRWTIWQPATDVLAGRSPYGDPSSPGFLAESVYPPLTFVVLSPLSWLSFDTALVVWQVLLVLTALAIPAVLRVRDWRCYAAWVTGFPVAADVLFGNVTLVVVLLAALAWRWRDRAGATAVALSLAIVVKLLAAPLWLWLVFTRRLRAALLTAILVPLGILVPWLAIGLDGLRDYPSLLRSLSESHGGNGVLLQALGRQSGLEPAPALAIGLAVAACCLVGAYLLRDDDISCFALVASAALLATPVAWIYYPALLVIPVAARFPRFNVAWLGFTALWVSWYATPLGWATAQLSLAVLLVCALMVLAVVRTRRGLGVRAAPKPAV